MTDHHTDNPGVRWRLFWSLTHFFPMCPFHSSSKRVEKSGFLTFPGWNKIGKLGKNGLNDKVDWRKRLFTEPFFRRRLAKQHFKKSENLEEIRQSIQKSCKWDFIFQPIHCLYDKKCYTIWPYQPLFSKRVLIISFKAFIIKILESLITGIYFAAFSRHLFGLTNHNFLVMF